MNSGLSLAPRRPVSLGSHLETDSPTQGGPLPPAGALLQPGLAHLPSGQQICKQVSSAHLWRGSSQRLPPEHGEGASLSLLEEGAGAPFQADPGSVTSTESLPMFSKMLPVSSPQAASDQSRSAA